MGHDLTYHLFARDEVRDVYFAGVADPDTCIDALAERFELDQVMRDELRTCFAEAGRFVPDSPFHRTHGMMMAIVAGYLRPYWYVRGAGFSDLLVECPEFGTYVTDWRDVTPGWVQHHASATLADHYCCGVFIDHAGLQRLRQDYAQGGSIALRLDETFPDGRLEVFWQAVDAAIAHRTGLIEAVDVVIPDPLDPEQTRCASFAPNCQVDGIILYARAAMQQLQAMQQMLEE